MEAYGAGPAYDVAPVEATHQAWVTPVVCSGRSSTPSPGSSSSGRGRTTRQSRNDQEHGENGREKHCRNRSGRRCRLVYRQRFGQDVVPLGNSPPEDERSRSDYSRYTPPAMRLARSNTSAPRSMRDRRTSGRIYVDPSRIPYWQTGSPVIEDISGAGDEPGTTYVSRRGRGTSQTTVLEAVRPRHLVTRTGAVLGAAARTHFEAHVRGRRHPARAAARTKWPRGRALLGKLIEVVILNPSEARREPARLKTLVGRGMKAA
jgi:hypothetical protein